MDRLELDEVELEDVADVDDATDPDDEDEAAYESEDLSDGDLEDLGYRGQPSAKDRSHQDELLDEGSRRPSRPPIPSR